MITINHCAANCTDFNLTRVIFMTNSYEDTLAAIKNVKAIKQELKSEYDGRYLRRNCQSTR